MNGLKNNKRQKYLLLAAWVLPFILLFVSLGVGTYKISWVEVFNTIRSALRANQNLNLSPAAANIIINVRLPRILLALLAGSAFAVSGSVLQSLFRNPLVNEYVLGVSFGAGFGAAASLVLFSRQFPPQVAAFLFGLLAVFLVLTISEGARNSMMAVLLTGIVVSAFFQSLLSGVEFMASPYALQALFFWLLGSFSQVTWPDLLWTGPMVLLGLFLLIRMKWRINVLSLSDDEARALGVNVKKERFLVIALTTLITSAVVSVSGIIGWVGLIVPHAVRGLVGADNRLVIPVSAGLGASLMLLADDLIRAFSPYEFPVGIITNLVGIPFFLYLIKRSKKSWG
jgi:iron complex transport system permease protein